MNSTGSSKLMLSDEDIDAEIQRLQEKEQELTMGNQRLNNQMNDLRELMKLVDSRYDNDARQLVNRNKDLEKEIQSLEQALKVSQKHGSHMDKMAQFFGQDDPKPKQKIQEQQTQDPNKHISQ